MPVRMLSSSEAAAAIPALMEVLADCVHGGASVGFMAPLAPATAEAYWRMVAEGVAAGNRLLFVGEHEGRVAGTVQIVFAGPENQPHRADVSKMLVHRRARRAGLGTALLKAAEAEAGRRGRSVLVLDTHTGSAAETLYASQGWQRVGVVPRYAMMPDGAWCDTTYFFKHLAAT